jgi:hypothetical protein
MVNRPKSTYPVLSGPALFLVLLTLGNLANAQSTVPNIANSPTGPFGDSIERRNRETALRSITMINNGRRPDARIDRAAVKQLSDDFTRIQVIRLEMVRDIKAGRPFEYKRLSDDSAEIRKRALRLRDNLALPEQENNRRPLEKVEFDKDKIQDAAADLCLQISQFIENPMFKSGGVYNVRNAAEGERSLDIVISLSTHIKTSADKLRTQYPVR